MIPAREFIKMPAELRERIGAAIESLVDLLDALDLDDEALDDTDDMREGRHEI